MHRHIPLLYKRSRRLLYSYSYNASNVRRSLSHKQKLNGVKSDQSFQSRHSKVSESDELTNDIDTVENVIVTSRQNRGYFGKCWTIWNEIIEGISTYTFGNDKVQNEKIRAKFILRTVLIYIIFITNIFISSVSMYSTDAFRLTNSFEQRIIGALFDMDRGAEALEEPLPKDLEEKYAHLWKINFTSITNFREIWTFLNISLVNTLFQSYKWYNRAIDLAHPVKWLLYHNLLIGVPRIRQVRSRRWPCNTHQRFLDEITDCYGAYTESNEEREPFGPLTDQSFRQRPLKLRQPWRYQSPVITKSGIVKGRFATYGGGGYYVDLGIYNRTFRRVIEELEYLRSEKWIDHGTRALIIDLVLYNPSVNLFCYVKLTIELPETGGVFPQYKIEARRLLRYFTLIHSFVSGCEISCVCFTIFFLIAEMIKIIKMRWKIFLGLWNLMDMLFLTISVLIVYVNLKRILNVNGNVNESGKKVWETNVYSMTHDTTLAPRRRDQALFDTLMAFLSSLSIIRIFKYADFSIDLIYIKATLKLCFGDLFGFLIMFIAILIAYAQFGNLVLGAQVPSFSTVGNAFVSLFRTVLSDFDYKAIEEANSIIGPIYFFTYVFIIVFALLNMQLAILIGTFSDVKQLKDEYKPLRVQLWPVVKDKIKAFLNDNPRVHERLKFITRFLLAEWNERHTIGYQIKKLRDIGYKRKIIDKLLKDFDQEKDIMIMTEEERKEFRDFAQQEYLQQKEMLKGLFQHGMPLKYLIEEQEFHWRARSFCTPQDWKTLQFRSLRFEELLTLTEAKVIYALTSSNEAKKKP